MNDAKTPSAWTPVRNWISLIGLVIAVGGFFSFLLLFAIDLFGREGNPYVGILTFVVAPAFMILGLGLVALGWVIERRAAKGGPLPALAIDFSRPQDRRRLALFTVAAALFLLLSAFGSFQTLHFSESVQFCGQTCHTVMEPEYLTYLASPHARVACVDCHVGPGAAGFIKAKVNGVHQLVDTLTSAYERPVKTPQHRLPAQVTCERCHWPQKYVGEVERTIAHYLSDETNSMYTVRLLLKVGGGDPMHGPLGGIHWHMNLANRIEFVATDDKRQVIPWVRFTNAKGEATEYRTAAFKDDPAKYPIRSMDCMDCHNRSAHQFKAPNDAVDLAMSLGRIDAAIPSVRANVTSTLALTNLTSVPQALEKIETSLRAKYPNDARIKAVIAEAQRIYTNSFFPLMRADWRAYPDNIGHKNWAGCFRCHDGQHKSSGGQKIGASGCNDCHLILAQGKGTELEKMDARGLKFAHPDSASEGTDPDCTTCHTGGP